MAQVHASFQTKAITSTFVLARRRRKVNPSIEFLVLFYTTLPKDFGEAKQNCPKKCFHLTVELFNLAKARDLPESASVFQ